MSKNISDRALTVMSLGIFCHIVRNIYYHIRYTEHLKEALLMTLSQILLFTPLTVQLQLALTFAEKDRLLMTKKFSRQVN